MKKLLALLLALCAVSALAEEGGDEIPSLENTPSYEGTEIAVADTGVLFTIPSDWNAVDAPEGYLATYVSADNTISLSLLLVRISLKACICVIFLPLSLWLQCTTFSDAKNWLPLTRN